MKLPFFILFFILITFNIFSFGNKEKMDNNKNTTIENTVTIDTGNRSVTETEYTTMITGNIQIYGNEPHTFVGIIDENGIEYAVYPPSCEDELRKLQGHLLEFTVILLSEPQGYGGLFLKGGTVRPITWNVIQ